VSSASQVKGAFVESTKGPIFVLARIPSGEMRGCLLVVPPFAEEMNKCRRMVTETSLRLAGQGWATVIPDLYGTGDSAGDFVDADWNTWLADLSAVSRWARDSGLGVTALLAVRLGAALAQHAMASGQLAAVERTVLWQPVFDTRRFLAQFLRLRVAASMTRPQRESLADIRSQLAGQGRVEVAGYALGQTLAQQLETLDAPETLDRRLGAVHWMETRPDVDAGLPAPSLAVIEASRRAGCVVDVDVCRGEPFWASTEIVVNDNLSRRTVLKLAAEAHA
jgi:exosortase A-associated hydrolase 2